MCTLCTRWRSERDEEKTSSHTRHVHILFCVCIVRRARFWAEQAHIHTYVPLKCTYIFTWGRTKVSNHRQNSRTLCQPAGMQCCCMQMSINNGWNSALGNTICRSLHRKHTRRERKSKNNALAQPAKWLTMCVWVVPFCPGETKLFRFPNSLGFFFQSALILFDTGYCFYSKSCSSSKVVVISSGILTSIWQLVLLTAWVFLINCNFCISFNKTATKK